MKYVFYIVTSGVRQILQGSHVIAIPHFYSFERMLGLTVIDVEFVPKL